MSYQAKAYSVETANKKLAEAQQHLNRKGHRPASLTGWMAAIADRLVTEYPSTSRATHLDAVAGAQSVAEGIAALVAVGYNIAFDVAITDSVDANSNVFRLAGGQGYAANGDSVVLNGTYFRVTTSTADFTDDALATAKGSAVAADDVFQLVSEFVVAYVGNVPAA